MWGLEAIMLSCGTNVQWLRDDLGIIETAADSEVVAAGCESTDGVMYVPAQLGLGTPHWDYGARGTLLGLTRGSGPQRTSPGRSSKASRIVAPTSSTRRRATAASRIERLRVDGGMTDNTVFVQALADVSGRPSRSRRSEGRDGGGRSAPRRARDRALVVWDDIAATWRADQGRRSDAEGYDRDGQRAQWHAAIDRAAGWYGELSALELLEPVRPRRAGPPCSLAAAVPGRPLHG
jgi:glycerol kinase